MLNKFMQQQPSPKSLKECAVFNGCFSVAFDKFVHFFSQSVNYTYTHILLPEVLVEAGRGHGCHLLANTLSMAVIPNSVE